LKQAPSNKFLQRSEYRLSDRFIEYLMKTPKYPIEEINIDNNFANLNLDFGTLNKDNGFDTNAYDYCQTGVRFFATLEGEERVHLVAMFTNNSPRGMSMSMYYLPHGKFNKACMVARFCNHRGANEHKNTLDDNVMPGRGLHLHKMSEEFYDYCAQNCKTYSDLVMKLQSPDAINLEHVDCRNIMQLVNYANESFNITDKYIYVTADRNNQVANEIRDQILSMEEGMEL